jgi:hypothetical protein
MHNCELSHKGRIEYIDAMRGFTMILVVYSHICNYCLGDRWMGFNDIFFLFRLPCFFFISGWLFGKNDFYYIEDRHPVMSYTTHRSASPHMMKIIKDKFMVQIVPTFIFLLILAPPPLFFSRLGATKGGYWFTFALFIFFLLYIFSSWLVKDLTSKQKDMLMLGFAFVISISAFYYDVFYNRFFSQMGWFTKAMGFISFMTWRYYLFFAIGALVRKHFEEFVNFTNKPIVIAIIFCGFALFALHPHSKHIVMSYIIFSVGGVLGMTMVFTCFRKLARFLSKGNTLGFSLQYIRFAYIRYLSITLFLHSKIPYALRRTAPQHVSTNYRIYDSTYNRIDRCIDMPYRKLYHPTKFIPWTLSLWGKI